MKRKIYTVLLVLSSVVMLSACKKEEEAVEEVPEDNISYIEVSMENKTSIFDMSFDELAVLSPDEVEDLVTSQLPSYRSAFGIDENRVMSEDDWVMVREILLYNMFGKFSIGTDTLIEKGMEQLVDDSTYYSMIKDEYKEDLVNDPDSIYYAPSYEYIYAMTLPDFANYLNDLQEYQGTGGDVDFTKLSDEQLQNYKEKLLQQILSN